jgi:hypothetical protein
MQRCDAKGEGERKRRRWKNMSEMRKMIPVERLWDKV